MPILRNARQELFCQAFTEGNSAEKAYVAAGYKPNRANAGKLRRIEHVSRRIDEILTARNAAVDRATVKAVEKAALSKAWVLQKLTENLERSLQARPVTDRDGNETGEYVYNGAVANKALELLGKEIGMFIERREQRNVDEFDNLDEQQLRELVEKRAAELVNRSVKH